MEALSPEAYQCAMKLNNMATFEWDLRQDTLKYDDIMYYILQHKLPKEGVAAHFEKARLVHPHDRAAFQKQINWIIQLTNVLKIGYQVLMVVIMVILLFI